MNQKPKLMRGELFVRLFDNIAPEEIALFATKYRLSGSQRPRWKEGFPVPMGRGFGGILEVPKEKETYYFRKLQDDWLVAYVGRASYNPPPRNPR